MTDNTLSVSDKSARSENLVDSNAQKKYWRSLDELAETPEFKEFVTREFPQGASEMNDPISRRNFLTVMGASMALAGLASCRRPVEKIVPYVIPPENLTPGIPQYYATTMPLGVNSYGLVVESHEGRPTKIEGNKQHTSTRGSSSALMQAEILNLYDPDRAKNITHNGSTRTWNEFISFWRGARQSFTANKGEGLALLSEPFNSPTMMRVRNDLMRRFPKATWVTYDAISDENIHTGIRLATGKTLLPSYDYANAAVIVSLESDFLNFESESVNATRGFADGRRMTTASDPMNRLYVIESYFSLTGGSADHRLRLKSSEIRAFTVALGFELVSLGLNIPALKNVTAPGDIALDKAWLRAVAKDLFDNRGASLVVVGRSQGPAIHALALAINKALDNIGATVSYYKADDASLSDSQALSSLTGEINAGKINTLIIMGGNSAYNSPGAIDFSKITNTIRLGLSVDETAEACQWVIPRTHFLEEWGDCRSIDGTLSVVQPLIEPLYNGHSALELTQLISTAQQGSGYELVRRTWKSYLRGVNFEKKWETVLHDGVLSGASANPENVSPKNSAISSALAAHMGQKGESGGVELTFVCSYMSDGRNANNGWLQELPDPVTKLTWDNAIIVNQETARKLNLTKEELATLDVNGTTIEAPVWIVPGLADNTISLALGYGRTKSGGNGTDVGANAFMIRPNHTDYYIGGVKVTPTGKTYKLACSQDHWSLEGRPVYREANLAEYKKNPNFAKEVVETPDLASLWTEHTYTEGYQWGMTIDLNACTGCNACTIACVSENNISVVGKEQVSKGREMHWIRIDRYFSGDPENPQMVNQPMACVHCEMAPCEQVCPVSATVHDKEGLNVMIYNRCIGTRYCSNNCPYKVRRFNFFNYTKDTPEIMKMAMNPDVTVRSRGVMEKCTYCTQRITRAKIEAKQDNNRQVKDGEIVTACQQACPAQAITFGNINDPNSKVSRLKRQNRDYLALAELNTRPRTSFLAGLRNPNPALPLSHG